jgi:hypothetical protein
MPDAEKANTISNSIVFVGRMMALCQNAVLVHRLLPYSIDCSSFGARRGPDGRHAALMDSP